MEDRLVDKEQWVVVDPYTKPIAMSKEDWDNRNVISMVHLCLSYSVLLNVSGEDFANNVWKKLGNLYQSKSLVNKLFL